MWIKHTLTDGSGLWWVITTPELESYVLEVFKDENKATSTDRQELDTLNLDPGGVISMRTKPVEFELEGYNFLMKPEHLWKVALVLSNSTFHDKAAGVAWTGMGLCHIAIPKLLHFKLLTKTTQDHDLQDQFLKEHKKIAEHVVTAYSISGPKQANWSNDVGEA